ncbi:hypothetical protein OS493_018856 [Desmophyllum pertusum]|uniref:Uncharacterized protein n=1 Tax=Desmophyllum pertusum TaxID=174260 RepID=A0A9W9ZD24_9CNID|nr:hypothetical protein OS493_018856 [Desmophyllum pertusum]
MYRAQPRKKVFHSEAKASQVCAQRKRMKQLSKSLGDLPNFKKEIDEKLRGKLPRSSPRFLQTRRLGETNISPEVTDIEAYLVTRDCLCVLQPKINGDVLNLHDRDSYTPPPSREADQRLKEIARENTHAVSFNSIRQKALKVDDIVHTASKLEAEYLKRAKSPVYRRSCTQSGPYGDCNVCEGHCNSEKLKPSSRLKKRTLVVKIPGLSDNLSEHNYRGGWDSSSNFSYRHKK